jgi:hypothetical protein
MCGLSDETGVHILRHCYPVQVSSMNSGSSCLYSNEPSGSINSGRVLTASACLAFSKRTLLKGVSHSVTRWLNKVQNLDFIIIIITIIMSVMELGHLLTRSGLMYLEVSSTVCHDSFCQLGNSVSTPWVICYEAKILKMFIKIHNCST